MTAGVRKTAVVLAGLVLATAGLATASDAAALGAPPSRTLAVAQLTSSGCTPQPPMHAWAVDVTDGGVMKWKTSLPTNVNLYSAPTLPLALGRVAIFSEDGSVFGLKLTDGKRLWRWRSGQTIYGTWRWKRLVVVLANQVGPHARLVGLDAATGAVAWVLRLPAGLYGGQVATPDGGLAVVGRRGAIEVVNLATGRVRWSRPGRTDASLGAADGLVLAAFGGLLHAYSDRTGRTEWTRSGMPPLPQVQVLGGIALVTSGETGPGISTAVIAVDPHSGRVAWRFDPDMPVTVLASGPAGLAVATYVPYRRLYLLNPATGRPRWRVSTAEALLSIPLVTATGVIGDEGGVVGFEAMHVVSRTAADGRPRWDVPLADAVMGTVVRVGSDAVVQANSEEVGPPSPVVAYRMATGKVAWEVNMPAFVSQAPVPAAGGLLVQPADLIQACALAR
jgi:outer membrane protein assembly factor BamB